MHSGSDDDAAPTAKDTSSSEQELKSSDCPALSATRQFCCCASRQIFSVLPPWHPHKQKYAHIEQHPKHTWVENAALMAITTFAPAAVSGGLNFALAYVMYWNMGVVRFWPFPNTIAGDLVVTTFIQGSLTYLLFGATLSADIRRGSHVCWPLPSKPIILPRYIINKHPLLALRPPSSHDIFDFTHFSWPTIRSRILMTITKGLICSFFFCLVLFPISIAILAPMYGGGKNMAGTYAPQVIKGVYGFVFGLLQTPVVAFVIMNALAVEREDLLVLIEEGKQDSPSSTSEHHVPVLPQLPPQSHSQTLPSRHCTFGSYRQRSATISFGAFPDIDIEPGKESARVNAPPQMRTIDKLCVTVSQH